MIVIFDTSLLVGIALHRDNLPAIVLLRVIDQGTLMLSQEVVEGYRAVLHRPKFARSVSAARREAILELAEVLAERATAGARYGLPRWQGQYVSRIGGRIRCGIYRQQ